MKIILVRHGQTQWNTVERFRGHFDIPLNATGLAQAGATARRIAAQWQPAAVYSSPLSRALVTAQEIARPFDLTPVPVDGLIDIDYGDWQGLSPQEAQERWPDQVSNWLHVPSQLAIPGGEQFAQAQARALASIEALAARHPNDTIVVVSHTTINRLVLLGILGLNLDHFWMLRQDNCAINALEVADGKFTLVTMNDTCHLDRE